nr:MAG TPA: hypothetical protein [Caudoviricetes sp.]
MLSVYLYRAYILHHRIMRQVQSTLHMTKLSLAKSPF